MDFRKDFVKNHQSTPKTKAQSVKLNCEEKLGKLCVKLSNEELQANVRKFTDHRSQQIETEKFLVVDRHKSSNPKGQEEPQLNP